MCLWDGVTGRQKATLTGHTWLGLTVSRSAPMAACWQVGVGTKRCGCGMWSRVGTKPPSRGIQRVSTSVAFSPDGGTLASGSEDGTVRLVGCGHPFGPTLTLTGHRRAVFSPPQCSRRLSECTLARWGPEQVADCGKPWHGLSESQPSRSHKGVVTTAVVFKCQWRLRWPVGVATFAVPDCGMRLRVGRTP